MSLIRTAGLLAACASMAFSQSPDWDALGSQIAEKLGKAEVRWEPADLEANDAGAIHARGARFAFSNGLEVLYQRFPAARWAEVSSSPLKSRTPTVLQIRGSELVIARGAELADQAIGVRTLAAVWAVVGNSGATRLIKLHTYGPDTSQFGIYATDFCDRTFSKYLGKRGYLERQIPLRDGGMWRERVSGTDVRVAQAKSEAGVEGLKAYIQAILDASPARTPDMPLGANPGLAQQLQPWLPKYQANGNLAVELSGFPAGSFVRRVLFHRDGRRGVARLNVTDDRPLRLAPLPVGDWVVRLRADGDGKSYYFRKTLAQTVDGAPQTVVFRWSERETRPALE